jgi:hypothetical protein
MWSQWLLPRIDDEEEEEGWSRPALLWLALPNPDPEPEALGLLTAPLWPLARPRATSFIVVRLLSRAVGAGESGGAGTVARMLSKTSWRLSGVIDEAAADVLDPPADESP